MYSARELAGMVQLRTDNIEFTLQARGRYHSSVICVPGMPTNFRVILDRQALGCQRGVDANSTRVLMSPGDLAALLPHGPATAFIHIHYGVIVYAGSNCEIVWDSREVPAFTSQLAAMGCWIQTVRHVLDGLPRMLPTAAARTATAGVAGVPTPPAGS